MPNEIEKALYDLIDFAKGRLWIAFYKKGQVYRSLYRPGVDIGASFAESDPSTAWKVGLHLFANDDFSVWLLAIESAKALLVEIKEQLKHECEQPDEFKAIIARVRFKETYGHAYNQQTA